jgi:hypothetical protein
VAEEDAPLCPYCGAAWTAAMLEQLDSHSRGTCGCCVVMPGLGLEPRQVARPQRDLCCDSCGKPIYTVPDTRLGSDT